MLWPRRIWWFSGELAAPWAVARCAGCGEGLTAPAQAAPAEPAPAEPAPAEPAPAEPAAALEYCSTCKLQHERHREAALLAGALGLLWGAACALALPLLRPGAGLAEHLLLTLLAATLPIAGLGSLSRRVGLWGSPPRVWRLGRIGVVLEGRALAGELERAGIRCRELWLPPLLYRRGVELVALAALAFAGLGYAWHHPRLWVLDLGPEPFTLLVDGVAVARLDASRADTPDARLLRLASGVRHLVARDDTGRIVAEELASLSRGREHLFAPGGSDQCFWLERTGYGRDTTHEASPLRSASRFFTLDADVDGWLGIDPPPASDRRSTGGTLTLLRHSPCPRAPEAVRAASAMGP